MADLLATSIVVFAAFWLLFMKLPLLTRLKLLHYGFTFDLLITLSVFLLYGGTGRGALAAAGAAVALSVSITYARKLFGTVDRKNIYFPGRINVQDKLINQLKHRNLSK